MNSTILGSKNTVERDFSIPANYLSLQNTMDSLKKNGIEAYSFNSAEELKKKLFELLPLKAEVMTMTSVTLDTLGITEEISNSGRYEAIRNKLKSLNFNEQRKIASDADYTIGSVHVVTEDGEILIASATGSQLSAYASASGKIIWVVGTQKIVKNLDEGMKRIYDYCLPLEDKRARKAYNMGSKIGKILTINSEVPERITILFLKQNIGF